MQAAVENNKYLFIWDKQGQVATFMNYKAQLVNLAPQIVKVQLNQGTNEEVGEAIRKGFVYGMRNGEKLCLDIDQLRPNFTEFNSEGTFVAE